MKVKKLKQGSRIESNRYNTSQRIKAYGDDNAYPQNLRDLIAGSRTAKSCLNTFCKFVKGAGFAVNGVASLLFQKLKVGTRLTFAKLHAQIIKDYGRYKGFAVHVNYNLLLDEVNYQIIPFEFCRLEVDDKKELTGRIAVHPDWSKESGKPFKNSDIEYFSQYTTDKAQIKEIIIQSGGFSNFKGLIYYYTEEIDSYPLSEFDPVRELMSAQISADAIRVRNVKNNFMPAGILYKKGFTEFANADSLAAGEDLNDGDREDDELAKQIEQWQGDENAAKIILIEQTEKDEDLKFVPFPIQNLDKVTENTDKTVDEGIRSYMCIPPELLGVAGARGFASETMQDAYDFYNSVTESDRNALESAYWEVFGNLFAKNNVTSFEISPLTYVTRKDKTA